MWWFFSGFFFFFSSLSFSANCFFFLPLQLVFPTFTYSIFESFDEWDVVQLKDHVHVSQMAHSVCSHWTDWLSCSWLLFSQDTVSLKCHIKKPSSCKIYTYIWECIYLYIYIHKHMYVYIQKYIFGVKGKFVFLWLHWKYTVCQADFFPR